MALGLDNAISHYQISDIVHGRSVAKMKRILLPFPVLAEVQFPALRAFPAYPAFPAWPFRVWRVAADSCSV